MSFVVVLTYPKGNSRHPDLGDTIYYWIPGYLSRISERKFVTSHPDVACKQRVPARAGKKIRRAKQVGVSRILKTLHFCATVSMHNFCSCFKHEENVAKKCSKPPWIRRQWIVHCTQKPSLLVSAESCKFTSSCQLFNSKLSTINDSTNEILIPGAGMAFVRFKFLFCHPLLPDVPHPPLCEVLVECVKWGEFSSHFFVSL